MTHVFHLAAQAGVRKSWGRDFDVYTRNNVEATQRLLEALVGVPIQKYVYASSSSVYGDDVPLPMREDTYLQPLSPYGVIEARGRTSRAPLLGKLRRARRSRCDISPSMDPRQRPDMGFPALPDGRKETASRLRSMAMVNRRATSRSSPISSPRTSRLPSEGPRAACTILEVAPGSR